MRSGAAQSLVKAARAVESQWRIGVVTQASPLLVKVGAATTGVAAKRISGYTPTLADVVIVLVNGPDRVVLGKVV